MHIERTKNTCKRCYLCPQSRVVKPADWRLLLASGGSDLCTFVLIHDKPALRQ